MTHDEALREIGVAPGSSQDEIRRAYLRLVKTRKPETDPEGFRRLREAFDLLCHLPEASPEIRLHPRPAVHRPAGPETDLEEVAEVELEDNPADLIEAAEAWISQGHTDRAVESVLGALQAAEAQGNLPHPLPIVLLILQLQAQEHAAEADRVQERLQRVLRSSGQELSLLDAWTAALWQVAQELPRLSADFPAPTRAAISAAVIGGAPERAIPQLLDVVAEDGDAGWRMAAEIKDLPGLGSLYHDALLEALGKWRPRKRVAKPPWHPGAVGGALIAIWILAQLSGSLNRPVPREPLVLLPFPPSPEPARRSATPPLPQSVGEALLTACPPGGLDPPGQAAFCQAAREAVGNLRQRRCGEVRAAREQLMEGLQRVRGLAFEQPAQDLIASLRAEYATVCQDDAFLTEP